MNIIVWYVYLPLIKKRRIIVQFIKSFILDPEAYESSGLEGLNFILLDFDIWQLNSIQEFSHLLITNYNVNYLWYSLYIF